MFELYDVFKITIATRSATQYLISRFDFLNSHFQYVEKQYETFQRSMIFDRYTSRNSFNTKIIEFVVYFCAKGVKTILKRPRT